MVRNEGYNHKSDSLLRLHKFDNMLQATVVSRYFHMLKCETYMRGSICCDKPLSHRNGVSKGRSWFNTTSANDSLTTSFSSSDKET